MLATTNKSLNLAKLLKLQKVLKFTPYLRVSSCRRSERHSSTFSLVPIRKDLYLYLFSD
jgi:hypothetical protein